MNLSTLKTRLQTITGTDIGEVMFDFDEYLNINHAKTYPLVLWSFAGADFDKDSRTSSIQKNKSLKLTAFIFTNCAYGTEDKITAWDLLEGYFDTYISKMNEMSDLQIENINKIKGRYLEEKKSADLEVGIMYQGITINTFC